MFRLRLALRYDDYFLQNVAGGSTNLAMAKVEKVVLLAKFYFWEPFSYPLGTAIELDIVNIKPLQSHQFRLRENDMSCNHQCNLRKASSLSQHDSDQADHFHYLTQDVLIESLEQTDGIAHLRGACSMDKYYRTSITAFLQTEEKKWLRRDAIRTAKVGTTTWYYQRQTRQTFGVVKFQN